MNKWKAKRGTTVYVQRHGEYSLKRDLYLSYEIVEPLQQFPNDVLKAAFEVRGSRFFAEKPTRLFIAMKEWPAKPNTVIAVHEEDLYYPMTTYKCKKCGTELRVKGDGSTTLVCPTCKTEVTLLLEKRTMLTNRIEERKERSDAERSGR